MHHASIDLPKFFSTHALISSVMLSLIDSFEVLSVIMDGILHDLLSDHQLLQDNLLHVLSPSRPCTSQVRCPSIVEEFHALSDGIVVYFVFPGIHSDSLENFSAKSLSCNCSNHIDSIFLFVDIVSPREENVLLFWNVSVSCLSLVEDI